MAEARRENVERHMNRQIETYPRDLLRRFGSGGFPSGGEASVAVKEEAMVEEVELSLGLSLGGSFGVDPTKKGLVRASSVAAFSFFPKEVAEEEEGGKEPVVAAHFLMRTCSLPVETGEEQRKRKEMQSLRRLEAKRKREEKRGFRPKLEDVSGGDIQHVPRTEAAAGPFDLLMEGVVSTTTTTSSSSSLAWRRQQERHNHAHGSPPIAGRLPRSAAGVQGGCSTSSSDYDCRPMQGLDISGLSSSNPEAKSPPSIKSSTKHTDQKAAVFPTTLMIGKGSSEENATEPQKKASMEGIGSREMARSIIEEMPCVSTKGDGPNGKKVEGFLYKYTKGEDVRIMCVCHGSFLSPAEFVKHAGGGDVEFPLKHIVVYPSSQTFL